MLSGLGLEFLTRIWIWVGLGLHNSTRQPANPRSFNPLTRQPDTIDTPTWNQTKEEALAKAWILTSDNLYKSNNQQYSGFWRKNLAEFNSQLGHESERTFH